MNNNFYTYAYLRKNKTPYYIGKGKYHKSGKYHRAYYGKHCTRIPVKERILILKDNINEEEAFKHEKYMIKVFGRKDLGTGILHNKTDGGEGSSGYILSEDRKRKLSESNSGFNNPMAKNIMLINISGECHIIFGEFDSFCRDKNLPGEGIRKRIRRGSKLPTKCGWCAFDITNKSKNEVEIIKNQFCLKYKNRNSDSLKNIKIPSNVDVAHKSINIVFNFMKEKIEREIINFQYINGVKYVRLTGDELKHSGVSTKTAFRAIKVLKENSIVKIEKLNESNLDHSNFYALDSSFL